MHQLILHPRDPAACFDPASLLPRLQQAGLIADPFTYQGHPHYRPGEHFLELITFLGCSPVVALGEPGLTGDDFCHVSLIDPQPEPRFIHGSNVKPPRCPNCRHSFSDWRERLSQWPHTDHTRCPQCERATPLNQLKWRQCAGFLRQGIIVWGIFEGEAVPSEQLLELLEQSSGLRWQYFYCQQAG